jgi:hypothetical protein
MSSGHEWKAPEMEKCELCGDKDWMADKYCSGNPQVAGKRKEWLEELNKQQNESSLADAMLKEREK